MATAARRPAPCGGAGLRAPILHFHREWILTPAQIGDHKVALHQAYLREWLRSRPALSLSFEELWEIREACIRALGTA